MITISELGMNPKTITIALFFVILLIISIVDLKKQEIPYSTMLGILALGVLSIFTIGTPSVLYRIIGLFVISVPLLIINKFIPGGFGGGDILMMASVGFFLGWKLTLVSFFFALVVGGLYGFYLILIKKQNRKGHFPFGPFLSIGIVIATLWGDQLLGWYLSLGKMY